MILLQFEYGPEFDRMITILVYISGAVNSNTDVE